MKIMSIIIVEMEGGETEEVKIIGKQKGEMRNVFIHGGKDELTGSNQIIINTRLRVKTKV